MSLLNHLAAHEVSRDLGVLVQSEKLARSSSGITDLGVTSLLTALRLAIRRAGGAYRRQRARVITERELRALDPRILRDIGVCRMDIDRVAAELVSRRRPTRADGDTLRA